MLMVVMQPMLGALSPVGTASAVHQCDSADKAVYLFTFGGINEDKCNRNHVSHVVEDMKESDANQTKVDIYTAALDEKSHQESSGAVYDNYINDTKSVAWMKAEAAIAEAYQNGRNAETAKVKAREAIDDYYTTKQINVIDSWNVSTSGVYTLQQQAEMEDGIDAKFVSVNGDNGNYEPIVGTNTTSVTLLNGTQTQTKTLTYEYYCINRHTKEAHPGTAYTDCSSPYTPVRGVYVQPPDTNYDVQQVMSFATWDARWDKIQTARDDLHSDVDAYVDATYPAYQNGEINASDTLSRTTLMFEYGTDGANGTSMYDSVAAAAAMGLDTPNLNGTGLMTVEYQSQQYVGLVMARNAPSGTWTANTTYDTTNITGPVLLASQGGELVEMDGKFTIQEITSKDGTSVETVETTKYVYQTSNTTELLEVQQQMLDLRQEIEDREDTIGVAGGEMGSKYATEAVIALVGIAALLLFTRRQ